MAPFIDVSVVHGTGEAGWSFFLVSASFSTKALNLNLSFPVQYPTCIVVTLFEMRCTTSLLTIISVVGVSFSANFLIGSQSYLVALIGVLENQN